MVDKRILTRAQADAGLTLDDHDPDVVLLKQGDLVITRYYPRNATIEQIRKDADEYLAKIAR